MHTNLVSTPMAFMKRKLSSTLELISLYLLPAGRFSTKSKFQACKREISAYLSINHTYIRTYITTALEFFCID